MSINWERLYKIHGKNNKKVGTEFEKIVLEYLQSAYPQYTWKDTKSSWDNNRDFIVMLLENIWAEAKYKKDCTALKKEDIDPTIVSGTLDGNVRMIFFITNGYVPQTILKRIEKASNIHSLNIICITRTQLEYWLILNPKRYKHYFKQELPTYCELDSAILIKSIEFIDQTLPNTNLLNDQPELLENQFYTMNITVEANTNALLAFSDVNCPFQFIDAPAYMRFDKIEINPGIQQFQLLIHTTKCSDSVISLNYSISKENTISHLVHTIDLKIFPNKQPQLVYLSQFICTENLINSLTNVNGEKGHIFAILGGKNTGKSFVQKKIMHHFYQTRQIAHFRFFPFRNSSNHLLFCRLIMFINFGNILKCFEVEKALSAIDYYKAMLRTKLDPIGINQDLILEVFEGCYDDIIAENTLKKLINDPSLLHEIINPQQAPIPHIALIDELQHISDAEIILLKNILNYSIQINNIVFLVAEQEAIYPENHKLIGLSRADIEESLKNNLPYWPRSFIHAISEKFSNTPNLVCENIILFKQWLYDVQANELTQRYLQFSDNVNWFDFRVELPLKYINILGLIYAFEEGISLQAMLKLGIHEEDIWFLCNCAYIRYDAPKLLASMQLYRKPFEKNYASIYIEALKKYLKKILDFPSDFREYFFWPEVYKLYCLYSQTKDEYSSNEFKKQLREYLYYADYLNLYTYSEIAFDYVNKKKLSDLTQDDFEIAFYYGISLMHCDRKRGAIEIFRWITNNANKQWDIYYMANCELFNSLYNRFEILDIDSEIIITQTKLENKIAKIIDENEQEALNIRIAYSTCMNRAMMIAFLEDNYENAETIFEDYCYYHNQIPKSKYERKYLSMLGEWKLDYARGMEYKNPNIMLNSYKEYLLSIREEQNSKRYLMAKYNFSFLNCAYSKEYDKEIENLHNFESEFEKHGFQNEYLRAYIGNKLCELVHLLENSKFRNSKGLKNVISKYKDEALSTELNTKVYTNGRLTYQIRMYLAALETLLGNFDIARAYLEENLILTQYAGDSYQKLTMHNLANLNQINTITWGFENSCHSNEAYILDPRIW